MRTGILLSARDKATRLPGKARLPFDDCDVTRFMLRRLAASNRADLVILATSTDPRDQTLSALCAEEGMPCFRGSPDDKLLRYRDAARFYSFDFVVVVDGDDPLISVSHIDRIIEFAGANASLPDVVTFDRLPLGATGFGVAAAALERICFDRPESDTEVWGHLFRKDPSYRCVDLVEDDPLLAKPELRLTLDFPEDYALLTKLVDGVRAEGFYPSFEAVMAFLAKNPELAGLNQNVQAAYELHLARSRMRADQMSAIKTDEVL